MAAALRLSRVWPCHIGMHGAKVKRPVKSPSRCIRLATGAASRRKLLPGNRDFEKYYCAGAGAAAYKPRLSSDRIIAVEHHKLDAIDLRILAELQANGRITNVELSRRAKITAPPCLRRMRALEKAGFIKGYHAELDGKALGFRGHRLCLCRPGQPEGRRSQAFRGTACARWPEVRECHMLSGEVDFLLKCVATRPVGLPVLHHRHADGGEECRQRENLAGDPCLQAGAGLSDRRAD